MTSSNNLNKTQALKPVNRRDNNNTGWYTAVMVGKLYFRRLKKLLHNTKNDQDLFEVIVNAPFHDKMQATQLDLGVVVLLLVNKKAGTIDRVALSNTPQARGAVRMSEKPFHEIKIPVDFADNYIAQAIKTGQPRATTDWQYLFIPALSPKAARYNQSGAGIECSCVHPLTARDGGALIFSYYQSKENIGHHHHVFMEAYTKLVSQCLDPNPRALSIKQGQQAPQAGQRPPVERPV